MLVITYLPIISLIIMLLIIPILIPKRLLRKTLLGSTALEIYNYFFNVYVYAALSSGGGNKDIPAKAPLAGTRGGRQQQRFPRGGLDGSSKEKESKLYVYM